MYDPTIGRWLSEEPLGFDSGDVNLHRYVGNAPTIYTDPSGMLPPTPTGLIAGAIRDVAYIESHRRVPATGLGAAAGPIADAALIELLKRKGIDWSFVVPASPKKVTLWNSVDGHDFFALTTDWDVITVWRPDDPFKSWHYFCHGLTSGGYLAPGGPYCPPSGDSVRLMLKAAWKEVGMRDLREGDIAVWHKPARQHDDSIPLGGAAGGIAYAATCYPIHSAILDTVKYLPNGELDREKTILDTKNDNDPRTKMSFAEIDQRYHDFHAGYVYDGGAEYTFTHVRFYREIARTP